MSRGRALIGRHGAGTRARRRPATAALVLAAAAGALPACGSPASDPVDTALSAVVEVAAPGCPAAQNGLGSVAGDDLIVTAGHVVAGSSAITVTDRRGRTRDATLVAVDPAADLALLRARAPDVGAVELADGAVGDVGVVGLPAGPVAFEVRRRLDVTVQTADDAGTVEREGLEIRAELDPGDSGAPLIRDDGRVIGLLYAISEERDGVAFAVAASEIVDVLDGTATMEPGPGECR